MQEVFKKGSVWVAIDQIRELTSLVTCVYRPNYTDYRLTRQRYTTRDVLLLKKTPYKHWWDMFGANKAPRYKTIIGHKVLIAKQDFIADLKGPVS